MPEYLSPGVAVEETAVPKSIEGVSTTTNGASSGRAATAPSTCPGGSRDEPVRFESASTATAPTWRPRAPRGATTASGTPRAFAEGGRRLLRRARAFRRHGAVLPGP